MRIRKKPLLICGAISNMECDSTHFYVDAFFGLALALYFYYTYLCSGLGLLSRILCFSYNFVLICRIDAAVFQNFDYLMLYFTGKFSVAPFYDGI